MTISGITSTYASFSAMRLTINVTVGQPASQTASGGTASPTDSVTLSPAATTTGSPSAATGTAAAPDGQSAPPSQPAPPTSSDRAAALFTALDADEDGAITEDEFKSGAKQILSQGRRPRHADHDDDHDHGDHRVHEGRGMRRLERKLDRLFDRVDANGDGSVDQTELTDALAAADARRQPPPSPSGQEPGTNPATGQAGATGTVVTFSMTFVSIAVKRYTTLQSAEATPTATAPSTGAAASGTTATPPQEIDTPLAA